MTLIQHTSVTSSQRGRISIRKDKNIWSGNSLKSLSIKKSSTGGRNNAGRVTIRGNVRGAKKKYRLIDFARREKGNLLVVRIEYDPNRTSYIALVKNSYGHFSYIIAPKGLKKDHHILCDNINIGNSMSMKNIPIGTHIHNIEMKPGKGGQLVRSAGTFATLISKQNNKVTVRLPSSEIIILSDTCIATIGQVSNPDIKNIKYGKAGRMSWMGHRPKVRGVAMNPVDHPHGGGEGKTSGGRHPVNKNGKPSKGYRTRNNKRTNKIIIKSRHKQ